MYSISYMYYSLIGTALTVLIGYIGSYLTQDPKDAYDAKLLHPAVFRLYQRFWSGDKPYYVKDVDTVVTVLGSNGSVHTSVGVGGIEGVISGGEIGSGGSAVGAKINHAFEPQNEANIIIGVGNTDKEKNPMEVIFTKSSFSTTEATKAPTITTPTKGNIESGNFTTPLGLTNSVRSSSTTSSTPTDGNKLNYIDVSRSYRGLNEKENV